MSITIIRLGLKVDTSKIRNTTDRYPIISILMILIVLRKEKILLGSKKAYIVPILFVAIY